jgi:hypothetical protein
MDNKLYAIVDLDGYATEIREAAAHTLAENNTDNLDDYITITQLVQMVRKNCCGFDDDNRPLLNEKTNEQIYESTITWIHNVALAKLAAQDLVECAWDDDANEMVFWSKETKDDKPVKRRNKKKNKGS